MPSLTSVYHFKCRQTKLRPLLDVHEEMVVYGASFLASVMVQWRMSEHITESTFADRSVDKAANELDDLFSNWTVEPGIEDPKTWMDYVSIENAGDDIARNFIQACFEMGYVLEAMKAKRAIDEAQG